MAQSYLHFSDLRDAKASLIETTGAIDIEFIGVREGFSVHKVRLAGSLKCVGTLFDGPDCWLFVAS